MRYFIENTINEPYEPIGFLMTESDVTEPNLKEVSKEDFIEAFEKAGNIFIEPKNTCNIMTRQILKN